ncbi:MAG: hypothetical protein ABFS42_04915 [Candidatus Krumholzibacteriota bacterium]
MKAQTYLYISGFIFGVICLGHVLRIINGWQMVIGAFVVPMAVSWVGAAITAGLLVWAIAMFNREEHQIP